MIPAGAFLLLLVLLQLNVQFPENVMASVEQALRWVHLVAGITWIGLLYFFNLVSFPVMKECSAAMKAEVVTRMMPRALWWFRWSAVATVLAGLLYFIIYLMRDAKNAGAPALAWKWLGWWFLVWVAAWVVMYLVMRPPAVAGWMVAGATLVVVVGASWIVLSLLAHPEISNRTLSISVGGGIGLMLLLNVWGIVWRAQKRIIAWTQGSLEGTPLPAEAVPLARQVYLASRSGFWLSFPMLFFMAASSHYPFLSGR